MCHQSAPLAAPQLVLVPSGLCSWICAARASSPLSAALPCKISPREHPALLLEATKLKWGTQLSPSPPEQGRPSATRAGHRAVCRPDLSVCLLGPCSVLQTVGIVQTCVCACGLLPSLGWVQFVFIPNEAFSSWDALSLGQLSAGGSSPWDISWRWHLAAQCPEGSWPALRPHLSADL